MTLQEALLWSQHTFETLRIFLSLYKVEVDSYKLHTIKGTVCSWYAGSET